MVALRIDPKSETLETYLKIDNGQLKIPFSQRPYEWDKPEVERLFDDLTSLYQSNNVHMLNFLTLSAENPHEVRIYDGQQRTITSILILAVFAHKLKEFDLLDQYGYTNRVYLKEENPLNRNVSSKRKLMFDDLSDQKLFYDLIDNGLTNISEYNIRRSSQKSFINNYTYITNLLEEFIIEHNLKVDEIADVLSTLLENTYLITIKTDHDGLARSMFESLNNTGKALDSYFVLKNDVVICLSESKVKDRWNSMDNYIQNYNPSNFLTTFATILDGKTTKARALESIYDNYDKENQSEMDELLDIMVKASNYYHQILSPKEINSNDASLTKEYIKLSESIAVFSVKQHYHLILSMFMSKNDLKDINLVLGYILNIAIRNFYFYEVRGNTIEVPLANLARDVYRKELAIEDIIKQLEKLLVTDSDLIKIIEAKNINTPTQETRMKFILREIYQKYDFNKEVQIKDSLKKIHYEHILPQNPKVKSQWRNDFIKDDLEKYTYKIGNGTLLLDKINHSASNRDFSDKKELLVNSDIPENKTIAANSRWGKREINARTVRIGNKIIEYLNSLIDK